MINLATLIAFWKKMRSASPKPERTTPLSTMSTSTIPPEFTKETVDKAREALKVLKLERQILGSAVTTIYTSQTKGKISQEERDRLLEKYKVDLKRLEKAIDENQLIVAQFDLESAREELIKNFNLKLAQIDGELKNIRFGEPNVLPISQNPAEEHVRSESEQTQLRQQEEQNGAETEQQHITDTETRIGKIRAEVLEALERLEQIETEG